MRDTCAAGCLCDSAPLLSFCFLCAGPSGIWVRLFSAAGDIAHYRLFFLGEWSSFVTSVCGFPMSLFSSARELLLSDFKRARKKSAPPALFGANLDSNDL